MNKARAAAIVTWVYAAGFGVSAIPAGMYQRSHGRLPSFFGLFRMFEGPWSASMPPARFLRRLAAFACVMAVAALTGRDLWNGRRRGAVANLALLPAEAVFWVGFALPLPVLTGLARLALLGAAWKELAPSSGSEPAQAGR